jgi:cyclic pyranopterin phosphate synthase
MSTRVEDVFGRPLESLRISVTDRCNLRCTYCMPKAAFAHHQFLGASQLLTFDEIETLARVLVDLGVRKIRLTGGEPLLRPHLADLVAKLHALPDLEELTLSTNGLLLPDQAGALWQAGLRRINVSLDAIDSAVAGKINGLERPAEDVMAGIAAAVKCGFRVKINAVIQRGVNESQVLPLARYAAEHQVALRFIEFMDVGNVNGWSRDRVITGAELRELLAGEFDLVRETRPFGDTAEVYSCRRTGARFGFIDSVSQPFCRDCNRLRLSADGRLFTCLFSREGRDVASQLRTGASPKLLAETIRQIWRARTDRYSEERTELAASTLRPEPKVEMSYIGG